MDQWKKLMSLDASRREQIFKVLLYQAMKVGSKAVEIELREVFYQCSKDAKSIPHRSGRIEKRHA